jgi:hypothetical protein
MVPDLSASSVVKLRRRADQSVTDDRPGRQRRFSLVGDRLRAMQDASDVDLAAMKHPPSTFVHDLASRLRCRKCAKAGRRPSATLLQLAWQPRHPRTEA